MKNCSLGSLCGVLQSLGLHKHAASKKSTSRSALAKKTTKKVVKKTTKIKAKAKKSIKKRR